MADLTLQLLGKLLDSSAERDAVHIAVAPVTAKQNLVPGQHVGMVGNGVAAASGEPIGIVDPFLKEGVERGQRFWLFLYLGSITSLRHAWMHPAFAQESRTYLPAGSSESERWLREYADAIGLHYDDLMEGADEWVHSKARGQWGEYLVRDGLLEGVSTHPDFWKHYQEVRGKLVPPEHQESFFSCSC